MAATLTVVPNPATVSTVVNISGTGFSNLKTRLSLDGAGTTTNIFRPNKSGNFNVGITVSSTPKTQLLIAQQNIKGNTWEEVARTNITVQAVVTPPTPIVPDIPRSLSGSAGDTVVNLTWQVPVSDGGSPITQYSVYKNGTFLKSSTSTSSSVTGLTNGTSYAFAVSAVNSVGEGPKTAAINVTPVGVVVPPPVTGTRALGTYVHGSAYDFTLLDSYKNTVGAYPAFATTYHHWGTTAGSEWPAPQIAAFESKGITPFLTWEAWNNYTGSSDPAFNLDSTLNGNHNSVLDRWITGAKSYGKPIYIRLAHEMNGNWYPWGFQGGHNGNTPAKFVAFWKYVVDRFRNAGATNVKWVWSPNIVENDKPITGSYPGDAYVDILGIDGYNWGTSQGWSSWKTFTQTIGPTYDLLAALSSKPIMVAETASTELGGNKATWITSAYATEIPTRFPRLVGILWFNQNKETDWRVESSTASLNAYKAVVSDPNWKGKLP